MTSLIAVCPAPFQGRKRKTKDKTKRGVHATEFLGRMVASGSPSEAVRHMPRLEEDDEPFVGKRQLQQQQHSGSPAEVVSSPPLRSRGGGSNLAGSPTTAIHRCHCSHCPCRENDSQRSSNASNESQSSNHTHSSGYQTDDGSFESKMLSKSSKDRPANLRMTSVKDYSPCCEGELALRRGQRVKVLYREHDWVYAVTKTGEAGYIPYCYVRPSRKYAAGYQSEPEYCMENSYHSGYDTDVSFYKPPRSGSVSGHSRSKIEDVHHSYNGVHQGFLQQQHSGGFRPTPPPYRKPSVPVDGYLSAVEEYPRSYHHRSHMPRPAKSMHSVVDAGGSSPTGSDHRPMEGKPSLDSFAKDYMEELVVIHDFGAKEEDEVFVGKGEKVKVLNADDPFWLWVANVLGEEGFIPRSCCALGNHPLLQSTPPQANSNNKGSALHQRRAQRYHQYQKARQHTVARIAREQAKNRFHELARQRKTHLDPVSMDKQEIQRVGSKLIALMDYSSTEEDELSIQFAEILFADVMKQAGAEKIWAFCPRTDKCGYVPISLVAPPVV